MGLRRTSAALVSALIAASFLAATAGPAAADPATVPDPPTNIGVVSRSESVVVSFDPPADDGGSPITQYRATCISPDANSSAQAFGTESPIVVYAMVNTYWYVCTVVATNAIGNSDFSDGSDQVVPNFRAPDTPVDVQVTSPPDAETRVTFTVPYDGGDANLWYAADCESSDGGTQRTANFSVLPMTVWGLTAGKTYTCRGKASQQYGSSSWSDPSDPFVVQFTSTVPDPPTIAAVEPHYESILVSFDPPANDGGAPIIGYTVNCESGDGGAASLATGAGSPMLVRTVTNAHNYNCTVSAQNGNGYGDPSDPSDDVVPNPQVPPPPTDLVATVITPHVVQIDWTLAQDDGSGLGNNQVECVSSDGGDPYSALSSGVPPLYVDTSPLKHYSCTLAGVNIAGTGPTSDPVSFYTDVVPDPPYWVSVERVGGGALVSWTDGAAPGSPINNHVVTCESSDGGVTNIAGGASSPVTVSGLEGGKTYTCSVEAENVIGLSAPSNPSSSFVVGTPPGAPNATGVANNSRNTIEVSFDAPDDDGNSDITGYTARCVSSDGGVESGVSRSGSPIVVPGLTFGKTYDCDASATNEFGTSAYGATAGPVTIPLQKPGPPEFDDTTIGHTSLTFKIGVPDDGGSAITSYDVECTSSNGGAPQTGTASDDEVVVSNLTPEKLYECTATVTNVGGTSDASEATDAIQLPIPPAPSTAPTVMGIMLVGQPVAIDTGTWLGSPEPSFSGFWKRCDPNGNHCVAIPGSENNPYHVLTNADIDRTLRFSLTADTGFDTITVVTAKTARVKPSPEAIKGLNYWTGVELKKAKGIIVDTASYGPKRWTVTAAGVVKGPKHYGDMKTRRLNKPVAGIAMSPTGKGYWLFAADGGVFAFGDAKFYGSAAKKKLPAPVVGFTALANGKGYFLLTSKGSVHAFGAAKYKGNILSKHVTAVAIMKAPAPFSGYWIATNKGRIYSLGGAPPVSTRALHRSDVVGMVVTSNGMRVVTTRRQLITPQ